MDAPPKPAECIGEPYQDGDGGWLCIYNGYGHMSLMSWRDGGWEYAGWTPALWELDVPLIALQAEIERLRGSS